MALAMLAATLLFLRQRPPAPARHALRLGHVAYVLVPLLVFLNGLTPYLEVKTGFGWNMYANLRTVDGDSNHFVVRRTLPLTDAQAEPVELLDTDDPALQRYVDTEYSLTWQQLRGYLSHHPSVRVRYRQGSAVVALAHASDDPELVEPLPVWQEKLQLFRPIDQQSPERCVPTFGAAR
jgi:hypothetical protein